MSKSEVSLLTVDDLLFGLKMVLPSAMKELAIEKPNVSRDTDVQFLRFCACDNLEEIYNSSLCIHLVNHSSLQDDFPTYHQCCQLTENLATGWEWVSLYLLHGTVEVVVAAEDLVSNGGRRCYALQTTEANGLPTQKKRL